MNRALPFSLALFVLGATLLTQNKNQAQTIWWAVSPHRNFFKGAEFSILSLITGPVSAVAVCPHNPALLYLGGTEGLFHSEDRGGSWAQLSRELSSPHILLVDPHRPARLYAARRDLRSFLPLSGVYRSSDGGISWNHPSEGLGDERIFALAVDPLREDTLYAGSWAGRIYRSTDGGEHWRQTSPGPPCPGKRGTTGTISQLLVHPLDGLLYALVDNGGLFCSGDGGERWTLLNEDSGRLALDPQRGHIYLAGWRLQRSSDGGRTWEDLSVGLPYDPRSGTYATLWVAINPDPLAIYTRYHRSTDGGNSWERLELPRGFVPRLLAPGEQAVIYGSVNGQAGRYREAKLDAL